MSNKTNKDTDDQYKNIYYVLLVNVLRVYYFAGIFLLSGFAWYFIFNYAPNLFYEYINPVQEINPDESNPNRELTIEESTAAIEKVEESLASEPKNTDKTTKPVEESETTLVATPIKEDSNSENTPQSIPFWLTINKIGVNNTINFGGDAETGLSKGIWAPSITGTPSSADPVIIASHRYGLTGWGDSLTRTWFFYLDTLQNGDVIDLTWENQKYQYKVTSVEVGSSFNKKGYDLLLYTCKSLNSSETIFVTATRV